MQTGFAYTKFADRLASIAELAKSDLDLLARMPLAIRHFASHDKILHQGDRPSCCCLLLRGYVCWRDADSGSGQISSIHVAGDMPDIQLLGWPRAEADLSTLGAAVVAFVPHSFFQEAASLSPNLSRAFSLLSLADAALLRNWIINLGSRDSLTRVAHLICEIAVRLSAVGQARDYRFPSPFTQSDLAAACGISAVHANRIIQELRRRRLLLWQSKTISILDWRALVHLAEFNPDYLRLRGPKPIEFRQPLTPFAADAPAASASQ